MNKKRIIKSLMTTAVAALLSSCGSSLAVVDPVTMLTYGKDPTEENLENLAKNYSSVINKNRKSGEKQPGVFSDYAVALARQGKHAEANTWFNMEMSTFPSSRSYVLKLKQTMIPEYINDNSINIKAADGATENETKGLSPKKRAAAEKRAKGVMDNENEE
ncbi:MAG: DUF4810 domain-containing protein [Bacteroidales bacterium]|nr:DUF4810 domain-containing protein [Bacteroidales bacterium]